MTGRTFDRTSIWATAFGLMALLVASTGQAFSADDLMIVNSVDSSRSTITIEGEAYTVTPTSRLTDEEGNRIPLTSVNDESAPMGPDQVRITTRGSGAEIATLEVVPMPMP
ncbi:MAG: hypothetical protein AB8G23_17715 [Myxococcota bacterium]